LPKFSFATVAEWLRNYCESAERARNPARTNFSMIPSLKT
jgi:hypothetical protein